MKQMKTFFGILLLLAIFNLASGQEEPYKVATIWINQDGVGIIHADDLHAHENEMHDRFDAPTESDPVFSYNMKINAGQWTVDGLPKQVTIQNCEQYSYKEEVCDFIVQQ